LTRSANTLRPSGCFKLSVTAYLPRRRFSAETDTSSSLLRLSDTPSAPRYGGFCRHGSGAPGFSILMTRAPNPANRNEANGPARACVRSRTVRPDRGLDDAAGCVSKDMFLFGGV